ncbi:MAG: sensor histidine kinase [Bacteroidetes bacterium]|nr:sensor histidine kinase [Bacteroidota bacterium]
MLRLILFFCLLSPALFSQDKSDSLLNELKRAKQDTHKVILLNLISKNFYYLDPAQTLSYAQQANKLALKNNYTPGIGNSYLNLGMYYLNKKSNDSALLYFNKGVSITSNTACKSINADLIKRKGVTFYYSGLTDSALFYFKSSLSKYEAIKDSAEVIKMLNNIGSISSRNGDLDVAIMYFLKCLHFDESKNDARSIAIDCNNLGSIFTEKRDFSSAEKYLQRAFKIRSELRDSVMLATTQTNLGRLYHDKKDFKTSLKQYFEALKLLNKNKNQYDYAIILNNIGLSYFDSGDLENAFKYYTLSFDIKRQIGDKSGLASSLGNLGTIYFKKKNFAKAIEYYSESEKIATETGGLAYQVNALYNLHNCYVQTKNTDKALECIEKYRKLNDSMYNSISSGQIAEMQTKYETEKKEKENSELKQKTEIQQLQLENEGQKRKNQLTVALLIIFLIAGAFLFIYSRKKQQQKAELAEAEKLRFKDVIDAEEKERGRIAQELHDGLGQLLSIARLNVASLEDSVIKEDKPDLDRALKIIDDACIEVRSISHNMMPSALIRLGLIPAINEVVNNINATKTLKIDFTTNLDTSLGKSLDITIYRVVQEVLNNMIKHAKADHIIMAINKNNGYLEINIQDNGIGFDTDKLKDSKGMGWKNIFSRVSMLDGTIKLDSELEKGTIVYINLKLKNG